MYLRAQFWATCSLLLTSTTFYYTLSCAESDLYADDMTSAAPYENVDNLQKCKCKCKFYVKHREYLRNHPSQRLIIKCSTIIQIELEFGNVNVGFRKFTDYSNLISTNGKWPTKEVIRQY